MAFCSGGETMSKLTAGTLTVLWMLAAVSLSHGADGQLVVTLDAAGYEIECSDEGDLLEMEGFSPSNSPGRPGLPVRSVSCLLPPGTRAVSAEVLGFRETAVPGRFEIPPSAGIFPAAGLHCEPAMMDRLHSESELGHLSSYSLDAFTPERAASLTAAGTLGPYSYATIEYCPFSYNAVTGELLLREGVQVAVVYESVEEEDRALQGCWRWEDQAARCFVNFTQFSELYRGTTAGTTSSDQAWDYLIIASPNVMGAIDASGFVQWKTDLGFSVRVLPVNDQEITGQPGSGLDEQIRNFLRENYLSWGVEYVLLVGNYASVPMPICYPDSSFHVYDPSNPGLVAPGTPTDCYYADLSYPDSLSWDLDGDGYRGEYNQDMPDFMPEVSVGRIPVSNPARVQYTLEKLVAFEQDTGTWKNNVLHAGSILFFENQNYSGYPFIDGATLLDSMETGLMTGWDIEHMSEQAGLVPSPFPWPPISEAAFSNAWSSGQHAIVNWSGHGWPDGAYRTVWVWDDGDGVPESGNGEIQSYPFIHVNSTSLDDDHPSIVFAISCDVGYPEPNAYGNCGIDLLTEPGWGASAGVVSASRPAAVSGDWKQSPGGTEQICFDFNRYMVVEGYRVGDALYWGKYDATTVYGWEEVYEYMNLYNFNLYGDPALEVAGIPTGIEGESGGSPALTMLPPGPNPFSGTCNLGFVLSSPAVLNVSVYDISGRMVREIADEARPQGVTSLVWDGTCSDGSAVPSGVYFVRADAGGEPVAGRLVLIR
jgi:hypothetical protein